jgi:hypothetical protein
VVVDILKEIYSSITLYRPGEVALSCNLSYWEARIGDGYEELLLNQPWET